MANFVQDQKGFLLGQTSMATQANLSQEYTSSCRKLENYDVNPDSSIQPRLPLKQERELEQNADRHWVFEKFYFYSRRNKLYVKLDDKAELLLNPTLDKKIKFTSSGSGWTQSNTNINENIKITKKSTNVKNIKKLEVNGNLFFFVFYETGPFYVLESTPDDVLFFYPFFFTDENKDSFIAQKFPFFSLNPANRKDKFTLSVSQIDPNTKTLKLTAKNGTAPNLLNTPIILAPKVINVDVPLQKSEVREHKRYGETLVPDKLNIGFFKGGDRAGQDAYVENLSELDQLLGGPLLKLTDFFKHDQGDRDLNYYRKTNDRYWIYEGALGFEYENTSHVFQRVYELEEDEDDDGNITYSVGRPDPDFKDPNKFYTVRTQATNRLTEGLTIPNKGFWSLYQAILDRFFIVFPESVSNGVYSCSYTGIGDLAMLEAQHKFDSDNFFISDFIDGYPIDVDAYGNKLVFTCENGNIVTSELNQPLVLSNPIKSLMNNRQTEGMIYNNVSYPGPSKAYVRRPSEYYDQFLENIPAKGVSFTLADATGHRIMDNVQVHNTVIHNLTAKVNNSLRVHIFTDKGIYLLNLTGIDAGIQKVSDFRSAEINPVTISKFLVFTNGKSLFAVDLNNSNNVQFDVQDIYQRSMGNFTKVTNLAKKGETDFLIETDNGIFRGLLVNKQFVGFSEYKFDDENAKISPYGIIKQNKEKQNSVFTFSDEGDEVFTAEGRLFPFTLSNYYPANGFFLFRQMREIYVLSDSRLSELSARVIGNFKPEDEQEKFRLILENKELKDADLEKPLLGPKNNKCDKCPGPFTGDDLFSFSQEHTNKGRIFGFSFYGSTTELP